MNTLWRARPFQALAYETPVLGLMPQDVVAVWRAGKQIDGLAHEAAGNLGLTVLPLLLPPGWASRFSRLLAPYLWRRIRRQARLCSRKLQGLAVTSPHYLELVKKAQPHVRTFYYCSDDYAQYENWGGDAILKKEAELAQRVDHCFFVSRRLADHAVAAYGLDPERVSVSPNATEEMFFQLAPAEKLAALFRDFQGLARPLAGVVGAINSRLDFELIEACCNLPAVGSVVMVGPVDSACRDDGLARLRQNPKCVFTGIQPHALLPVWMQALDVALIPYRHTPLNQSCSPMRLFDHLAAGRPMVATDGCPQVRLFEPLVKIGKTVEEFTEAVKILAEASPEKDSGCKARREMARQNTWASRSRSLHDTMTRNFDP